MKTQKKVAFLAMTLISLFLLITCMEENFELTKPDLKSSAISDSDNMLDCNCILNHSSSITPAEEEMLKFTREEEKLARDVYISFSALYSIPVFKKIFKSEQIHMDKVLCLLIHYNIEDPASDLIGVFKDSFLQELYNSLITKGSASLTEALIVGATIEDLDMVDLRECIHQTENEAIITIFGNLMCGSGNHLRSFIKLLENLDVEYTPQFLTQDEYEQILEEDLQDCKSEL